MRYALIIAILLSPVYAHDQSRPDLTDWLKQLHSPKSLCCSGRDALKLEDPDWRNDKGHYSVRLPLDKDGDVVWDPEQIPATSVWVDVPDDAVVEEPNQARHALVWPIPGNNHTIRCFLPGSMS